MKNNLNILRIACRLIYFALIPLFMNSCNNSKDSKELDTIYNLTDYSRIRNIEVSTNTDYYNKIASDIQISEFVVLNENDETMFADIGKIICFDKKIFILDRTGANTVVSFDDKGLSITNYGIRGKGKGEYINPWDIDVDNKYVYVLDGNHKKLIIYNHRGSFIKELKVPFISNGFALLENGNYVFSFEPSKKKKYEICVTDTFLNIIDKLVPRNKKFIGGWITPNVFRKTDNGLIYYQAPLDNVYLISNKGKIDSIYKFDFKNKGVPEIAKQDFVIASEKGLIKNKLFMSDSPIPLSNEIWVGELYANPGTYSCFFNIKNNDFGSSRTDRQFSTKDIINPICMDENKNIIGLLDHNNIINCKDLHNIPDSIVSSINSGKRVLVKYKFENTKFI